MTNLLETEYGEIRGILAAFTIFNNKKFTEYKFNFIKIEKDVPLEDIVKLHYPKEKAIFKLHEVKDWKKQVESSLDYFLFDCFKGKCSDVNWQDVGGNFLLIENGFQQQYINTIVEKIERVSLPSKVWQVELECVSKGRIWDGFIVEGLYSNYLLLFKLYISSYDFLRSKKS